MTRGNDFKEALARMRDQMATLNEEVTSFMAKIKRMPQGASRWELEEWIITECHIDPKLIRTKPTWSKQDWIKSAVELKYAARQYRDAGKLARAASCEADAKIAEERATWMA